MRNTTKTTEIRTEKAEDVAKKMSARLRKSSKLPKLLVILGPTASGKTALSLELAHMLNGEIISADSRQIYKDINIGSDKIPVKNGRYKGIPHHMINIVSPEKVYTMSDFKRDAEKCIEEILKRGRLPMMVGGTGLYIRAITENFQLSRARGKKSREKGPEKYNAFVLGLIWPREEMYRRVHERVDEQIKKGLIEEARVLLEKYDTTRRASALAASSTLPALSSLGLKEFSAYFRGEMTLNAAMERIKKNTRNYAKRQITWFKKDKNVHWLAGKDVAAFVRAILPAHTE